MTYDPIEFIRCEELNKHKLCFRWFSGDYRTARDLKRITQQRYLLYDILNVLYSQHTHIHTH